MRRILSLLLLTISLASSGAPLSLFTAAPHPATSGSSGLPAYLSGLADYGTRPLSGMYAPASGNVTMTDVTPSEWLTSDPGNVDLAAVTRAWSGGPKGIVTDVAKARLTVLGGGHQDSANNGVYIFNLVESGGLPLGWDTPLKITAVANVPAMSSNPVEYTDSPASPPSAHTYDGAVYVAADDCFYRFFGSSWGNIGGAHNTAWRYCYATDAWTRLTDTPMSPTGASYYTAYDSTSGKIAIFIPNRPDVTVLRLSTLTYSDPTGSFIVNPVTEQSMAYDSMRSRAVVVGSVHIYYTMDWDSSESFVESNYSPSGDTTLLGDNGLSTFYDADADTIWFWGGTDRSSITTIYGMNPSTFVVTAHTLGSSIPIDTGGDGTHGTFGRFVFIKDWRTIFTVQSVSGAVYAIKLPAAWLAPANDDVFDRFDTRMVA